MESGGLVFRLQTLEREFRCPVDAERSAFSNRQYIETAKLVLGPNQSQGHWWEERWAAYSSHEPRR